MILSHELACSFHNCFHDLRQLCLLNGIYWNSASFFEFSFFSDLEQNLSTSVLHFLNILLMNNIRVFFLFILSMSFIIFSVLTVIYYSNQQTDYNFLLIETKYKHINR